MRTEWTGTAAWGMAKRDVKPDCHPNHTAMSSQKNPDTICVKKYGPSSDHILRSNPVVTLLLHCPRVHGFSLFGKLNFTVYRNYEKQSSGFWSDRRPDVSVSQSEPNYGGFYPIRGIISHILSHPSANIFSLQKRQDVRHCHLSLHHCFRCQTSLLLHPCKALRAVKLAAKSL